MNGHQDHQTCIPLDFFLRDKSEVLCTNGKDKLPGPPAEPDHCSLLGSQKGYVEKDKQWVTFFKASINQNGERVKKYQTKWKISSWFQINGIPFTLTHKHSVRTSQETAFFHQKDQSVKDVRGKYFLFNGRHEEYMNIQNIQSVKHGGTNINN
jgi:hypothetical protein